MLVCTYHSTVVLVLVFHGEGYLLKLLTIYANYDNTTNNIIAHFLKYFHKIKTSMQSIIYSVTITSIFCFCIAPKYFIFIFHSSLIISIDNHFVRKFTLHQFVLKKLLVSNKTIDNIEQQFIQRI